eukprot:10594700-Prorocentrum_lima.AAC.1
MARINYKCALVFVDDLAIMSRDVATHVKDLRYVLALLYRCGHTVNIDKSTFFTRTITYLGYKITENEVRPDEKYIH